MLIPKLPSQKHRVNRLSAQSCRELLSAFYGGFLVCWGMDKTLALITSLIFWGAPILLLITEELSALFFLLVSGVLISVFPIAAVLVLAGIFQIYFGVGLWLYSSFTQTQYPKKLFLMLLLLGLLLSAGVSLIFTFD